MTEKSKVSLVRCWDYEEKKLDAAMQKAIELIGGFNSSIRPGKRALLKPNCLDASRPDKGVTTHPLVFKAAAKALKNHGVECCFGDSPAVDSPSKALKAAGFSEVAKELGISASDFYSPVEIENPGGKLIKKFILSKAYTDIDFIISLPKLKTHGQTYFTGAVKNMFGLVPGLRKAEFHFKLPDTILFSQMIVDLYALTKPALSIMDGIVGMEGNGPKGGHLRDVGLLMASYDGVALDAVACRVIGLDPMMVPTIRLADEQGLGRGRQQDIEITGEDIEKVKVKYFQILKPAPDMRFLGKYLSHKVKNIVTWRPVINESRCTACYTCVNICPAVPKAMTAKNRENNHVPVIDYKICIRCYCCQEVCPKSTIKLERNFVVNIFITFYSWGRKLVFRSKRYD